MSDNGTGAQKRSFKMHPQLLWDVIHRQAGSISKAILEGVMNSVDAGATRCDVKIDRNSFSISDDGKGFTSDEEIDLYFETFGYPHQEGDARYGRFRMGRGQMMAFGRSHWETNNYVMDVDFKPQKDALGNDSSLGYDFRKVKKSRKGCHVQVELYEPLAPSLLDSTLRDIAEFVKYVDIPVTLNGKTVSTDPRLENWDEETPDAFIKRKQSGSLDVYNMGALVCRIPSYRYGTSGTVVTKDAVNVNFARNDIQSDCKVWKRIMKKLKDDALNVDKKKPITADQREFLVRSIASGEATLDDLDDARIVTDVTGSHFPFSTLLRLHDRFGGCISVAPKGDRVAEMAHTRKIAFVVSEECATNFGAETPAEMADAVVRIASENGKPWATRPTPVERDTFLDVISQNHEPLADKELNKAERMALKAIREGADLLFQQGSWHDHRAGTDTFRRGDGFGRRKISAGASDTAQGWTNGTTDIWIERRQMRKVKEGYRGMLQLSGLLLHEYLHAAPDTDTHDHGVEFYERFHDIALDTDILPRTAMAMLKSTLKQLRGDEKTVTQTLSQFEDIATKAEDLGIGSWSTEGLDAADLPAAAADASGDDAGTDAPPPKPRRRSKASAAKPEAAPKAPEPEEALPLAARAAPVARVPAKRRKPVRETGQMGFDFQFDSFAPKG